MITIRRFGLYSVTWLGAGKADRRIFLLVMLAHLAFMIWYNSWQSPACDESSYFSYAIRWAKGHPERTSIMDDSKTPIVLPALWSLSLRNLFPSLEKNYDEGLLSLGRMGMYGYFYLLSFGFFCWSYRLFGAVKWVLPWLLFLADPLLISNALLIGSDMASACCMFWAFYLAWRFSGTRNMRYWWLLCMVCGIALLVKLSMVIVIPLIALLLWIAAAGNSNTIVKETAGKKFFRWVSLFAICLMLINAGYQFSKTGLPLKEYAAQSRQIKNIREQYPLLSSIPMPVPVSYISSYDLLLRNAEKGGGHLDEHSYHGVFLNGAYKKNGGFRDYYLWHFFYKTTPLLIIALAGSFFLLFWYKAGLLYRLKKWCFVWLPPLSFLVWLSIANPFQIGIRHAIPAWPFLYLLAGPVIVICMEKYKWIGLVAVALQFAGIARQLPNLTAYTPIWMQPKQTLYRRMNDASISYCNDARLYHYFLQQHPEYQYPTPVPASGKFALRLDECNSFKPGDGPLSCWLLRYFTPVGHYKSTILLFEISEEEKNSLPSAR
jgi:hypothetical protein